MIQFANNMLKLPIASFDKRSVVTAITIKLYTVPPILISLKQGRVPKMKEKVVLAGEYFEYGHSARLKTYFALILSRPFM